MTKIDRVHRLLQDKLFPDKLLLILVSSFHVTEFPRPKTLWLVPDTKVIMGLDVSPVRPEKNVLINSL